MYYQSQFEKAKFNIKKTWSIIKEVINSETIKPEIKNIKIAGSNVTNDKKTIANHFDEFFTNIGPNLAKNS